jgi:hypothetical protein
MTCSTSTPRGAVQRAVAGLSDDADLTDVGVGPSIAESSVSECVTSAAAQAMHARAVPPADAQSQ